MKDFMKPVAGNKMVELKAEINDLKALLAKTDDPDRIRHLKKVISEKADLLQHFGGQSPPGEMTGAETRRERT